MELLSTGRDADYGVDMSCTSSALHVLNERVVKIEPCLISIDGQQLSESDRSPHYEIAIRDVETFFGDRCCKLLPISHPCRLVNSYKISYQAIDFTLAKFDQGKELVTE